MVADDDDLNLGGTGDLLNSPQVPPNTCSRHCVACSSVSAVINNYFTQWYEG